MKKREANRPIFYNQSGKPVDASEWVAWCDETHGGKEYLRSSGSPALNVDTVFLGIDHQLAIGPPLLYLTLIKGGAHDRKAWLSATAAEAEERHQQACELVGIERPPRFRLV